MKNSLVMVGSFLPRSVMAFIGCMEQSTSIPYFLFSNICFSLSMASTTLLFSPVVSSLLCGNRKGVEEKEFYFNVCWWNSMSSSVMLFDSSSLISSIDTLLWDNKEIRDVEYCITA